MGQALPSQIRAREEDPSIVVTGTVEDVVPSLKKAGIFICPVRLGGGFRGIILEAMSIGTPVVSTALGAEGIPATHRENIMIADSPEDFVESIIELIDDTSLYKEIQIKAQELMEKEFGWEKGVARLEKVLLDLMERPPRNIPETEGIRLK